MAGRGSHGDDNSFQGLFTALEAGYQAVLEREEDTAASDLALSLLQGRPLMQALLHAGPVALVTEAGRIPIFAVGPDHVVLEDRTRTLVPFAAGVVVAPGWGRGPTEREESFLQVMRGAVRDRREVEVATGAGRVRGRLLAAAEDHLVLGTGSEHIFAGLPAIRSVALDPWRRGDGT